MSGKSSHAVAGVPGWEYDKHRSARPCGSTQSRIGHNERQKRGTGQGGAIFAQAIGRNFAGQRPGLWQRARGKNLSRAMLDRLALDEAKN